MVDAKQNSEIIQNEVFGSVITVQCFSTEGQVFEMANDVVYGLGSSLWTSDVQRVLRVTRMMQYGTMTWAVENGIIGGNNGALIPSVNATRGTWKSSAENLCCNRRRNTVGLSSITQSRRTVFLATLPAVKSTVKGVDDEMAVFRVEKNKGYTVMSNHHLRNDELTLKAKGLLSQMLSLPENWDYRVTIHFSATNNENMSAKIKRMLRNEISRM